MSQTTTPSGADVLKLLALVNAASPGPWETDVIKCDGEYGDGGPNGRSGYMAEQMHDANGVAIFDSLNSEGAMIDEDIGEESVYAWDVVANRNFEAVAAAMNFIREHGTAVAALISRNAELEAERVERDAVIECKNIDIRERDESIKGWADRARKAESERDALAADNLALREVVEATLEACESDVITNTSDEDAVGVLEDAARCALARTPAKGNDDVMPVL